MAGELDVQAAARHVAGYLGRLREAAAAIEAHAVARLAALLAEAAARGATVYTMGNGGSAATASHIVCDLNKGASYGRATRHRAVCLSDNTATLMAYANDVDYREVFVEQLRNFCRAGDVVLAYSGSGNSENILRAVRYAKSVAATVVGFCGFDGGQLKREADLVIHAPVMDMQIAEDLHLALSHAAAQLLMTGGT